MSLYRSSIRDSLRLLQPKRIVVFGLLLSQPYGCTALTRNSNAYQAPVPAAAADSIARSDSKAASRSIVLTSGEEAEPESGGIEQAGGSVLNQSPLQLIAHLTTTESTPAPSKASLSMMDALEMAARNNPHMRVIAYVPLETGTRQDVELAAFDPTISAGGQWMQANQQVSSAIQASGTGINQYSQTAIGPSGNTPNLLQVEQRYSSGTTARIGMNSGFNQNSPGGQFLVVNPAYQSSLNAVLEQSLFRGFGSKVNMAGLHIAKANQQQSLAEFQITLNSTLYEVQQNYWTTWLAKRDMRTYEELVSQAELTWQMEQKRLEIGQGTLVEPAQALEHLQTMRVELEEARQRAKLSENKLKSVLGIPASYQEPLDLTEEPIRDRVTPDLVQGIHQALDNRPEIEACSYAIQQAQLDVDRSKNFAKPDVSAYAGYALTGLDDGLMGSLNRVASTEFGNASLGLRFKHVWGGRAANANIDRAELALSRQRRQLRETQAQLEQSVRDAHDATLSTWEVMQRQNERLAATEVQFQTYSKLYEAGQLDLDRLVRARTQLANALHERQTAVVDYNVSLATWNHVTGSISRVPERPLPPMPEDNERMIAPGMQKIPAVELEPLPRQ